MYFRTHILSGTLYNCVSVLNEVQCHLNLMNRSSIITIPVSNNVLLNYVCVGLGKPDGCCRTLAKNKNKKLVADKIEHFIYFLILTMTCKDYTL